MNARTINPRLLKQSIKWTIYFLLLVNFALYLDRDSRAAIHTLTLAEPFITWIQVLAVTQVFAASIDHGAWMVLILLFELETYLLSDEQFTPLVKRLLHGIRLACYAFILHTAYAYSANVYKLYTDAKPLPEVTDLCQLADDKLSFITNQDYVYIDADNCAQLGKSGEYVLLTKGRVVADRFNYNREKLLAWLDLLELLCWLTIMMLIEVNIRLQDRGVARGRVTTTMNYLKPTLYGVIFIIAVYWGTTDLFFYFWDEVVWIGGFAVIEMNVLDWRAELKEERATLAAPS